MDNLVQMVKMEIRVPPVHLELMEQKEHLAFPDLLDHLVLLVALEMMDNLDPLYVKDGFIR